MVNESRPRGLSVDGDGGMLVDDDIVWADSPQDSVSEDPFQPADMLQRKKLRKIAVAQRQQSTMQPASTVTHEVTKQTFSGALQRPAATARPRMIIDRSNNMDNPVKFRSAKPYVKKAIFGLYNAGIDETVESLSAFVSAVAELL